MSVNSLTGSNTEVRGVDVHRQYDSVTAGEHASVGQTWDRREFIGTVAVTAMAALVPTITTGLTTTSPATAEAGQDLLVDWTIDDMFGVWPRYADPIPHGNSRPGDTASDEPLNAL